MNTSRPTLMVSAGEASGDIHAAHALQALKERGVEFNCFGMGADRLKEAGMELTLDCRELAVIGIVDVLINYPRFMRRLAILRWAWRKKRIHRIGSLVSHMAVLFPFEVDVYEQENIPVTYVGHPLVDDAKSEFSTSQAREHLQLSLDAKLVGLLPGSRNGELKRNLPIMLKAAAQLKDRYPDVQFVLPVAPTLETGAVNDILDNEQLSVSIVNAQSYNVMRAADAVLSASGTATLETAMLGTPMTVMYVINALNYWIMKRLIQIDDIGLVNIVAGKRICQEFVQDECDPKAIALELEKCLFDTNYRQTMMAELSNVQKKMGTGGASQRVAKLIESMLPG